MTFEQINERNTKRFSLSAKKAKIRSSKDKLAKDDYKIIKCAEAIISAYVAEHPEAGMPYDVADLIASRNLIRNDINILEDEIKVMEAE